MEKDTNVKPFRILIADDDFEDFLLIKNTFETNGLNVHLTHVEDGQYLIDILKAQGKYNKFGELPKLVLLDLNMPRKNGFDVLKEMKENPFLKRFQSLFSLLLKRQGMWKRLMNWALIVM